MFETVQQLMAEKGEYFGNTEFHQYPLSIKIECSECGSSYKRKMVNKKIHWVCRKHDINAKECLCKAIAEETFYQAFIRLHNKLLHHYRSILFPLQQMLQELKCKKYGGNIRVISMLISKNTFVGLMSILMKNVDEREKMMKCYIHLPNSCQDCIMEENEFQVDLINMLTVMTNDYYGVIRDYLNKRDENNEYFFGVPRKDKLDVYLLTSPEDLYNYLVEENRWFSLSVRKE